MKYEDIEVGKTYLNGNKEYHVKYKYDRRSKVAAVMDGEIYFWNYSEYKNWTEKHELPEKGLVVRLKDSRCLIYRTGEESGYGFNRGKYRHHSDWSFGIKPELWRPATKEEEEQFKELLEKEALNRGFTADRKLSKHADGDRCFNLGTFHTRVTPTVIYNQNGIVFELGKWAEPLEDALSEQIEELKATAKDLGLKVTLIIE